VIAVVGTARCAVRAAERRNELHKSRDLPCAFRPLLRGRGQRSALSLPFYFSKS
jgi:hypothetical protein